MSWKEKTLENLRKDFIKEVEQELVSFSALCRKYQITRKTGYKWYNRYKNGENLSNKSCRPFHTPNKTSKEIEEKIASMRKKISILGKQKN